MQNVNVVFKPEFHVLSNGALVFTVSIILCPWKWIKLFTETVCSQTRFSAHSSKLTAKPSAPFERALMVYIEKSLLFCIYIVFIHDFCLWKTWEYIRTRPVRIYGRYAWYRKQSTQRKELSRSLYAFIVGASFSFSLHKCQI
jgi:hypothetical protein